VQRWLLLATMDSPLAPMLAPAGSSLQATRRTPLQRAMPKPIVEQARHRRFAAFDVLFLFAFGPYFFLAVF